MIKIKFHSYFRERFGKEREIEYFEGMAVKDVLEKIGLKETDEILFLVNDQVSRFDRKLSDGDIVTILPQVAGG